MPATFTFNTQYQAEKARALRKNGTEAEKILWEALRNRQINNLKFRRQHPLVNYIVDFCCAEKKLIIELDGSIHDLEMVEEYDNLRQNELEEAGYTILRFQNDEVINDLISVVEKIKIKV